MPAMQTMAREIPTMICTAIRCLFFSGRPGKNFSPSQLIKYFIFSIHFLSSLYIKRQIPPQSNESVSKHLPLWFQKAGAKAPAALTVIITALFDPCLFLYHKIYPYNTHPLQSAFLHLSFKDRFSSPSSTDAAASTTPHSPRAARR